MIMADCREEVDNQAYSRTVGRKGPEFGQSLDLGDPPLAEKRNWVGRRTIRSGMGWRRRICGLKSRLEIYIIIQYILPQLQSIK